MVNKYGPPAPQSAAEQRTRSQKQDGADPLAAHKATQQPASSAAQDSYQGVSGSVPALFRTQAETSSSPESPAYSEDPTSPSPPPAAEPTLAEIMMAIKDVKTSLTIQMESIHIDFSLLKQDVHNLRDRTGEVEGRVSSLEDVVHPLSATMRTATDELGALRAKLDDLENRSRRNNLRFVGFPEKSEGSRPERFLHQWLRDVFGMEEFSRTFEIERAHRTPPRAPQPGAPPRSLIAKFLNFRDKVAILRLAREKGPLKFNGNNISIYPDFSAEVQRQRVSFAAVKDRLRNEGLPYAMLFPAKLRIIHEGKAHFCTCPKDAMAWLDARFGKRPRHRLN